MMQQWREYFKKLKILPLQSQYILSLLLFVVDNGDYFKVNSEIHNINTRNKLNLHLPISNLSVYQKGTYHSGIKVFNSLPSQVKDLWPTMENNLNVPWKISCTFFHFILWMNILAVTGFKLLTIVQLFFYVLKFYLDTILYSQCTSLCLLCSDDVNYFLGRKYLFFKFFKLNNSMVHQLVNNKIKKQKTLIVTRCMVRM